MRVFKGGRSETMISDAFDALPSLDTLTVAYNGFHYPLRTVRQLAGTLQGFDELTCVDLGVFETISTSDIERRRKLVFNSSSLTRNLPEIREILHNNEISDLMIRTRSLIKGDSFVTAACITA